MKSACIGVVHSLLLVCLFAFIVGCNTFSPQYLGISNAEWQSYSLSKQRELENIYFQKIRFGVQRSKTEVKPASRAVANLKPITVYVFGGTVIMPPFTSWFPYRTGPFDILPETCRNKILQRDGKQQQTDWLQQIVLRVCYKNGILFLDPSRYDVSEKLGTLRIHYSPLWEQGFTYDDINTTGYVRLKKAHLTIRVHQN